MTATPSSEEETKILIELICKNEQKPTLHTIDGCVVSEEDMVKRPSLAKYRGLVQYTCLDCHCTYSYMNSEVPKP